MTMDNILVVSRTRLPFNYQAIRTNMPELGKRDVTFTAILCQHAQTMKLLNSWTKNWNLCQNRLKRWPEKEKA